MALVAACDPQPPMTANTLQQPSQVTQTIRMAEYRVAPGDRIRVVVLSDPELSGEYEIDSAGITSLDEPPQILGIDGIAAILKRQFRPG